MSPAAPPGSVVRCVGGIRCVAGGSSRILRPMCRWDLLCRRPRPLPDQLSDLSVGLAVSPATFSGSFVKYVGGACCVAGGSFLNLHARCRCDLMCRRRLSPDPSFDVSVGIAASPADPSGPCVKCLNGFAVSLAAHSGAFFRWINGICCVACSPFAADCRKRCCTKQCPVKVWKRCCVCICVILHWKASGEHHPA